MREEKARNEEERAQCWDLVRQFEERIGETGGEEADWDEDDEFGEQETTEHYDIGTPQRARSPTPPPKVASSSTRPSVPLLPLPAAPAPTPPPGLGGGRLDKLTEIVSMDKIMRPDKPQLSAADAATLHAQLRNFGSNLFRLILQMTMHLCRITSLDIDVTFVKAASHHVSAQMIRPR